MRTPNSFSVKSPIPVYALALPSSNRLLYAGGGGVSRSGVSNAIRCIELDHRAREAKDQTQAKLSNEEDAPMCMAVLQVEAGVDDKKEGPHKQSIVVGINSAVQASGNNENLRLFEWKYMAASSEETLHASITSTAKAASVDVSDAEVYVKCSVLSPDGKLLAMGSSDGQMALHAVPSLNRLWLHKGSASAGIVDATFSADSALIAFVTTVAVQIYPTATEGDSVSQPDIYQSIRNPALKGTSGCVFRAARFGKSANTSNGNTATALRSDRLYTVVNTNPPAGLGTSKKDREKAKVRKCFVSAWDVEEWTLLSTRQIADRPATVADMSADGKYLAVSTSDLTLHLLSTPTLRTMWQLRDAHAFPGTCLAFSPQGDVLVSGSADMSLQIVSVGDGKEPAAMTALFDGKIATMLIAATLAFLAWYLQAFFVPGASPTFVLPAPSSPLPVQVAATPDAVAAHVL